MLISSCGFKGEDGTYCQAEYLRNRNPLKMYIIVAEFKGSSFNLGDSVMKHRKFSSCMWSDWRINLSSSTYMAIFLHFLTYGVRALD